jgi:glycosyltransferase involved in cell wall biosynthesis
MIGTVARVARTEGLGSVARRGAERISESLRLRLRLARGAFAPIGRAPLLNVLATPPAARLGGVQIQLLARLQEERALREVAFLHPGVLEISSRAWREPAFQPPLDRAIDEALARIGTRTVVIEGTHGVPAASLLGFDPLILAIHDFSLFDDPFARQLLERARAVVFPSDDLRHRHRSHFDTPLLNAHVIEPGLAPAPVSRRPTESRERVAYAGAVKPHKGGHLMPEIIAALPGVDWHIFGGGDENLLRPLRRLPRVKVHGYYRSGALLSLLARHDIGLALIPSVVPESYCLALSECWAARVPVVAFDHGALGERIRRHGGGWLAPLEGGTAGIVEIVNRWQSGELTTTVPEMNPTPRDAALAHVALYRSLGLLG